MTVPIDKNAKQQFPTELKSRNSYQT